MHHGHSIEIKEEHFVFGDKLKKFSFMLIGIGLLLTIIGIFSIPHHDHSAEGDNHHHASVHTHVDHWGDHQVNNPAPPPTPEDPGLEKPWYSRITANLLVNSYFFLLIGVCSLFFVALQYLANAGWSSAIKRIPEAMSTFIPVAAIVMIVVLVLSKDHLYHWANYEHMNIKPGEDGYDRLLDSKKWFLNSTFFISSIIIIPLLWILFQMKLKSLSVSEDKNGGLEPFRSSIKWSAGFTFVFAFSLSILTWVVTMSIDAHWFSTIFSVYNFATGFVTTMSIITLTVLYLKSKGYLKIVSDEHIHDLGKFMFAFSVFWSYIWLAQYLLIWYAQIPEEVYYYQVRFMPKWKPFFFINLVMNFAVPLLVLMTRDAKRNPVVLTTVGLILIAGHWNDVYLMVMPGSIGSLASIGLLEIGMFLLFAGMFIFWVFSKLTKQSLIPVNHPYIEESAHHDVGV